MIGFKHSIRIGSTIFALFAWATAVHADTLYLNGAVSYFYNPGSNGAQVGDAEYDSFNTPNSSLYLNGVTETPIALSSGLNTVLVTGQSGFLGLGLYFTTTGTLLDGASHFQAAPDLAVLSGAAVPAAGVQVATIGQYSGTAAYSGATSFAIGDRILSVTHWDGATLTIDNEPAASVPEPGNLIYLMSALLFGGTSHLVGRSRNARKRQESTVGN